MLNATRCKRSATYEWVRNGKRLHIESIESITPKIHREENDEISCDSKRLRLDTIKSSRYKRSYEEAFGLVQLQRNVCPRLHKEETVLDQLFQKRSAEMLTWPIFSILDDQQKSHVVKLAKYAHDQLVLFDTSQPGCGKSYAGLALGEQMFHFQDQLFPQEKPVETIVETTVDNTVDTPLENQITNQFKNHKPINVFIISVKAVLCEFKRLAKLPRFQKNIRVVGIANLELAVLGKYYTVRQDKAQKNPYLSVVVDPLTGEKEYQWKLPARTLVIVDEGHKTRNTPSQGFKLLQSLLDQYRPLSPSQCPVRMLISTATFIEKSKQHLPVVMYFAGLISIPVKSEAQKVLHDPRIRGMLAIKHNISTNLYPTDQMDAFVVHHLMFEGRYPCASGMNIKDTIECRRNVFAKLDPANVTGELQNPSEHQAVHNEVKAIQCIMSEEHRLAIQSLTEELWHLILKEENKQRVESWQIVLMTKLRTSTEFHKIDTFMELIAQGYKHRFACIMIVNFKETLHILRKRVHDLWPKEKVSLIFGKQTEKERMTERDRFCSGQSNIIIMSQAGVTGISLHAVRHTDRPRLVIMSPPLSATLFTQAQGRAFRNGCMSDVLQLLVLAKNTIEEKICKAQRFKMEALDIFNGGLIHGQTTNLFDNAPLDRNLRLFSEPFREQFRKFMLSIKPMIE